MKLHWTPAKLRQLYDIIKIKGLKFRDAAKEVGFSASACRRKWSRMDWTTFLEDPDKDSTQSKSMTWDKHALSLLYTMRKDANLDFIEIGRRLSRSPISCERKFQTTNWSEMTDLTMLDKTKMDKKTIEQEEEENRTQENINKLVVFLIELSRHSSEKMDQIKQPYFLQKAGITKKDLPCKFEEIVEKAKHELKKMGLDYPEELELGEGTYIVVGDSHGKHTKRACFAMLDKLVKHINPVNIIHIGHALDDDGEISYLWEKFSNCIFLAKQEELKHLAELNFDYQLVRNEIRLGKLSVVSQDMIQDYTNTFIGNINPQMFPDSVIVNSHKHEMDSRTLSDESSIIASPGCLCEPHIVRTIRQIDFWDNKTVRVSYPDSFIKYRRMKHICKTWEQGVLIVNVDKDGNWDIHPCRINKIGASFSVSYFDKIITSEGVFDPEKKLMFVGDAHCSSHDPAILDMQEQFAKLYKPDSLVDVGDLSDHRSFNHHIMEQSGFAILSNCLKENAHAHHILKRRNDWAKEQHLIIGNHERFPADLVARFPQFTDIFNNTTMLDLNSLKIKITGLKEVLNMGSVKFIHGDVKMYGAKGLKSDKVCQTFGRDTVYGHVHYPSIRSGCYTVGLTGKLDQDYNEPTASRWVHGFGYVNIFKGKSYISLVNIQNYRCAIGKHTITAKAPENWDLPPYKASMTFTFNEK